MPRTRRNARARQSANFDANKLKNTQLTTFPSTDPPPREPVHVCAHPAFCWYSAAQCERLG